MRITQSMLTNNMMKNLSSSYARMGKYQDQLATGKKINRPSDDPVVAMKGIAYRTSLMEVEQYKRNFGEAYNWVENTDSSLDKATLAIQRIRELTVQASNDTYEEEQRLAMKQEIEQLKEHLKDIINTKVGDKYIFNGTDTTNPPILAGTDTISTNSNPVEIELSKGVQIQVNINPGTAFAPDILTDIDDLMNKLDSPATSGEDLTGFLGQLDEHVNNLTNARAELGARTNRLELMEDRVLEQEVTTTRMLSDNEDADIERVITDLITQESVHRAALGVGARIIQPSLLDFLR
ncbi:flagellar hook-associated protein FlgL [Bacillus sp. FJAT-42315]|uniref:flagellar hook-associated protein FlgL n=1 Tax=Bacillus sp. FJAT-42315 TaxID=2014077 RepID=UPI000BA9A64E|nr:flagellar hook-associated protein FlgL [Bacillus sp. FJAT-42315]PAQ12989.1 flagellar hook-associated protein FlgL [Bacillaceae bacterium SAOS 7]